MKTIDAKVKITVGDKKEEVAYVKKVAESLEEMWELVSVQNPDLNAEQVKVRAFADFSYGNDLKIKSEVRREWEKQHEDPEKVIKKAADALVVAIPGLTFEQARNAVVAQRAEAENAAA